MHFILECPSYSYIRGTRCPDLFQGRPLDGTAAMRHLFQPHNFRSLARYLHFAFEHRSAVVKGFHVTIPLTAGADAVDDCTMPDPDISGVQHANVCPCVLVSLVAFTITIILTVMMMFQYNNHVGYVSPH